MRTSYFIFDKDGKESWHKVVTKYVLYVLMWAWKYEHVAPGTTGQTKFANNTCQPLRKQSTESWAAM